MIPWWWLLVAFPVGVCVGVALAFLPRHWRWTWGHPTMTPLSDKAWAVFRGWWFNPERIGMVSREHGEGWRYTLMEDWLSSAEYTWQGPFGSREDAARACWTLPPYRSKVADERPTT